jgi:Domain of unknown function (DUF6602)
LNQHLADRLRAIQDALRAHHRGGAPLPSRSKGDERETLVRTYLQQVFPVGLRFGRGVIVDSLGHRSGEVDVVVECPIFPSFPMPGADERLYLAESVAAAISVKSNLAKQWQQVESEAQQMNVLRRNWQSTLLTRSGGVAVQGPCEYPVPMFVVGYTGYKRAEALRDRLLRSSSEQRPQGALCLDSGAYANDRQTVPGPWGLLVFATEVGSELQTSLNITANPDAYIRSISS